MTKQKNIQVQGLEVGYTSIDNDDFISITVIAKWKIPEAPADIIKNGMRSKNTIELLGLWARLNNPDFKLVEFDQFRNEAGELRREAIVAKNAPVQMEAGGEVIRKIDYYNLHSSLSVGYRVNQKHPIPYLGNQGAVGLLIQRLSIGSTNEQN